MQRWIVPHSGRMVALFMDTPSHDEPIEVTVRTTVPVPAQERTHWAEEARCVGVDAIEDILDACKGCPVRGECMSEGRATMASGPYGGYLLRNGRVVSTVTSPMEW